MEGAKHKKLKEEIDKVVGQLHSKLPKIIEGYDPPPHDPKRLIEAMGGEVIEIEDPQDMIYGEARVYPTGDYKDRKFKIEILKEGYPLRQRFTLAHEVGHLFLHYFWGDQEKWEDTCEELNADNGKDTKEGMWRMYNGRSRPEYEANHFAASFLMPEDDIEEKYKELENRYRYRVTTLMKLSKIYKVSSVAVEIRLKHLGIISW